MGDLTFTETIQLTGDYALYLGGASIENTGENPGVPLTIEQDGFPGLEDDVTDYGSMRIRSTLKKTTVTTNGITVTWVIQVEFYEVGVDEPYMILSGEWADIYRIVADGRIDYHSSATATLSDDFGSIFWNLTTRGDFEM